MNQDNPVSQTQAPFEPATPLPQKRGFPLKRIVLVLILIAFAAAFYLAYKNYGDKLTSQLFGDNQEEDGNEDGEAKEYINSEYSFSFAYPPDVELREDAEGFVYLQKMGPTQKEGTELYDGVSLTITPGSLSGRSIKDVVDDKISEFESQRTVTVTKQPELSSVGEKTAYIFEGEGIGTFRYIYIPVGPDNYVEIVDATQDPGDEGFRSMVDSIISSIEY